MRITEIRHVNVPLEGNMSNAVVSFQTTMFHLLLCSAT